MQPQVQAARYGTPARTGAEIDVAEFFGKGYPDGGLAHFLYSYPRKGVTTKYGKVFPAPPRRCAGKTDTWWSRYHVFSVRLDLERLRLPHRRRPIPGAAARPSPSSREYLILSLLTSDWELP